MPDRILRDELLTSPRYWAVSIEAQRLYVHLILVADDTARFSGKNYTIRTACFPGHPVAAEKIESLLADLVDQDLVRIYSHDGERYVFIPRYRQRLRYPHSRYPEPPREINDVMVRKTDSGRTQDGLKTAEVKRSEVTLITDSQGSSVRRGRKKPSSSGGGYSEAFELVWKEYPSRIGDNPKTKAFHAWRARISEGHSAEEITAGVRRYKTFLSATGKLRTEFVKQAATFFGPEKSFLEEWSASRGPPERRAVV